ncbi:HTTM domain-containing protein [Roseimaritima ulvae]|nr:HTTM domain-containing protein [Roseimaritima ulvae]
MQRVDRFLFASCSPATCVLLRVAYAALLLIYVSVWSLDAVRWFSDVGVLHVDTARTLSQGPSWALFFWLPATPTMVKVCLAILGIQSLCLLLGIGSRFQAACIFLWLVSFQSRNSLIADREDDVFRVFAFCLMFMPLDHAWSLGKRWWPQLYRRLTREANAGPTAAAVRDQAAAWGLRLLQIHLTLMYLSAAASKWLGVAWRDGSALFYVYQMDNLFGRGPLPEMITQSDHLIRLATWSVLVVETALPFALWYRRTRVAAVVLGIGLHLSIEYTMHLFLFQWIMVISLLSFIDLPSRTASKPKSA